MHTLLNQFGNKKNVTKFIEVSLPMYNILKDNQSNKDAQLFKILPITINSEMKFYNSIKQVFDGKIANSFQMYEDILEDIIIPSDSDKILDFNYLTIFDINFIIYNARLLSYGSSQSLNFTCNNCKQFYEQYTELYKMLEQNTITMEEFEQKIQQLKKDKHINKFSEYMINMNKQFYTKEFNNQELSNFEMEVPDKKENVIYKYITKSGNTITVTPPKFGWYKQIKPYLLDFRLVEKLCDNNKIIIENPEYQQNLYAQYSNISLYIDSIDNMQINMENIFEVPLVIQNLFVKNDIVEVMKLLENYKKYELKIPFSYECDVCGTKYTGDVTTFPIEYFFNVKI